MKPNHQPLDLTRVCELKLGDRVLLSGREYRVIAMDENRITCKCDRLNFHPQYFKAKSQQKVELVKQVKSENDGTEKRVTQVNGAQRTN